MHVADPPDYKCSGVWHRFDVRLVVGFLVITLTGVVLLSRYAFVSLFVDGLAAGLVMIPPMLAGLRIVPLFRTGPMPLRWHLLLGAALGLGAMSWLVLMLGLAGVLHQLVLVVLVMLLAADGLARLHALLSPALQGRVVEVSTAAKSTRLRYLWLLAAPFLSLALVASTNAPGFIWQEEGYGYDALEYHLQMPKEYYQAGRIEYAPHNVYANFPANVEMLYLLGMIVQDEDVDAGVTANLIHLIFGVLTVFAAWVVGRGWSPRAGIVCGVITATTGWLCYLCGLAYVENGLLFFGMVATGCLLRAADFSPRGDTNAARAADFSPRGDTGAMRWIALAGVVTGFACGCKYTALPMIALPLGVVLLIGISTMRLRRMSGCALMFVTATIVTFSPWLIKNLVMTGNPVFPLANSVFKASPPGWGEEQTVRWDRGHAPSEDEATFSNRLGSLWRRIPGDRYQRYGPVVMLLGLGGLLGRRRNRVDWGLVMMLLIQLAVWLFVTHLYARFAVVLLIPLSLLAGRAVSGARGGCVPWVVALLVGGCAWNFAFAENVHRKESPGGAPAAAIYDGHVKGYEYFKVVNHQLPPEAKILLVGEARGFYFQRAVDYCVVFNRNPFIEVVQAARADGEIIAWMHDQGYTHILVNWSEIRRLRGSRYGFARGVNADLFDRLTGHGLGLIGEFEHPGGKGRGRYVTLYGVPETPPDPAP